ncbi:MAG: hypothetical protein ACPG47_04895 [Leucothrix sp.]
MTNALRAALFTLSFAVLAGCSSTPAGLDRKSLAANKIKAIDLTAPSQLTYTRSQGASRATSILGGGLVGALVGMGVDGAINMNRASTVAPVIKALGNYDTNDRLRTKLATLKGPSFAPGLAVKGYKVPVNSSLNVLNVASSFMLSSNHQAVGVSALTKLQPSAKSPIYTKRFSANSPIDMGLKDGEKINATDWLTKHPAKLKQAIERAMDSIVQQISVDINVGPPAKSN